MNKKLIIILNTTFLLSILLHAQQEHITLTSPTFQNREPIPKKYTCKGNNFSPELSWNKIKDAKSYILFMEDPDAQSGTYTHWIVYNIPADVSSIPEHMTPHEINAMEGVNSSGTTNYVGPCPPLGSHNYYFTIYALDIVLNIPNRSSKTIIERAMQGHVIAKGSLMGTYKKE